MFVALEEEFFMLTTGIGSEGVRSWSGVPVREGVRDFPHILPWFGTCELSRKGLNDNY